MGTILSMPKLSDTMTQGTLISWLKKEGESIEPGDAIAEVESDKANMEMESYDSGIVRKLLVKPGDAVEVGRPIAILSDDKDEDISELIKKAESGGGAPPAVEEKKEAAEKAEPGAKQAPQPAEAMGYQAPSPTEPHPVSVDGGRVLASPLARKLAQDYGLDISRIQGSGPKGRVVKADVEQARLAPQASPPTAPVSAAPQPAAAPKRPEPRPAVIGKGTLAGEVVAATKAAYTDHKLSDMRAAISRRLLESKTQIPHFYVSMEIAMEKAEELRNQLKELGYRVSINDLVLKAAALALTKFPMVNASFQGDKIRAYQQIDIGVAVSIEDGLIVPVVRQANLKGLAAIGDEVRALAKKARDRKLKPEEFTGATFTISNMGMYNVNEFAAIINPPEAAILAISSVLDKPVVREGQVVPGRVMTLTLSADHRVVDGAMAAEFLGEVRTNLENPLTLAL